MKNKKLLVVLLFALVMLLPVKAFAKTYYAGHETKNFKETLEAEEMTLENKDYKETSKQVTIYLFRGQGCGYCRNFITFLNSISKEYGDKFKLVSFEVWNNQENNDLMKEVSKFTGEEAGGVPYIIIGEKVFGGYIDSWNDQIKAAIDEEYKAGSKYDVFEEMVSSARREKIQKVLTSGVLPLLCLLTTIGFGVALIILQKKNTEKILKQLSKNNTKVVVSENEEKAPVKSVKKGRK